MLILFFKSASNVGTYKEPAVDKMRLILESHVEDAETGEERGRAEGTLRDFTIVYSKRAT